MGFVGKGIGFVGKGVGPAMGVKKGAGITGLRVGLIKGALTGTRTIPVTGKSVIDSAGSATVLVSAAAAELN